MTTERRIETPRGYDATRQHLELLVAKRDKLDGLIEQAAAQYCLSVKREWDTGHMSWRELKAAFDTLRSTKPSGYSKPWSSAGLPDNAVMTARAKTEPEDDDGAWRGIWPLEADARLPHKGVSVAYVLFDGDLEPVYVGSTSSFIKRMGWHERDGKMWRSWVAYPCRDREHAYQVEESFLKRYMPRLNVKRGR